MSKLDEELEALFTPLGVRVEPPGMPIPIHVEVLAHTSYEFIVTRLYSIDETSTVESPWHGTTYLGEVVETFDTVSGSVLEGIRIAPCTPEVERVLTKQGVSWCATSDCRYVLAALSRGEIILVLLGLGHEHELAARRRSSRRHRTARASSECLRQVLWQGEATRFLPSKDGNWLAGWLDGYCVVLADGLLEWIRLSGQQVMESLAPQLMLLAGEGKSVDHVVLQVGTWFLDGNGISSRSTLLRRWQNQEGLVRPRLVAYDQQIVEKAGIPRNQEWSCALATCLMQVLGPFSLSWLTGEG